MSSNEINDSLLSEAARWLRKNPAFYDSQSWLKPQIFRATWERRIPSDLQVENGWQYPPLENCFSYVIQNGSNKGMRYAPTGECMEGKFPLSEFSDSGQEGDIVFFKKTARGYSHAGILISNDLIRSKWGNGPIITCPLDAVRVVYGEVAGYIRRNAFGDRF